MPVPSAGSVSAVAPRLISAASTARSRPRLRRDRHGGRPAGPLAASSTLRLRKSCAYVPLLMAVLAVRACAGADGGVDAGIDSGIDGGAGTGGDETWSRSLRPRFLRATRPRGGSELSRHRRAARRHRGSGCPQRKEREARLCCGLLPTRIGGGGIEPVSERAADPAPNEPGRLVGRFRQLLLARLKRFVGQPDSNGRPPAPKAGALPDCAMPRKGRRL